MDKADLKVIAFATALCLAIGLGVSQTAVPVRPSDPKEDAEDEADAVELLSELSEENGSTEQVQENFEKWTREAVRESRVLETGV